jgi:hypothetical protein
MATEPDSTNIEAFITRWEKAGGAERANYQLFLTELCDLLDLERPNPAAPDNQKNSYTFERSLSRKDKDGNASTVYMDLYKSGSFVLETKQGVQADASETGQQSLLDTSSAPQKSGHGKRGSAIWDKALDKAYHQARAYIRDLPAEEGRPPFLIVCDVGYVIELYAEFTCTGGTYLRFPDPKSHRIYLEDLRDPEKRQLLCTIWTDPMSLDPSQRVAKVTRDIADVLARLAKSLESRKNDPEQVALFLQRCLFTFFAEDIGLLPDKGFENLIRSVKDNPGGFVALVEGLWKDMAGGTPFSPTIRDKVHHFNGGLFDSPTALKLTEQEIALLLQAARKDWAEVEPAIFGTLLERALNPRERHKLGAHYTPTSYVERLLNPTLMEPLRAEWETVKTAAALLHEQGDDKKARAEVEKFHHHLCKLKILDPACGSGNFLFMALARMKELETEVLDLLETLGGDRTLELNDFKVRPDQFWGMEINEQAVAIAQLVLWIGYFQWHHKTTGNADTNDRPLLPKQNTILHQDAVLTYDKKSIRTDADGKEMFIWDGRTTKPHPVTGKEVPDPEHKKPLWDYSNPRRPKWPEADFIIGNPPFLGASRMREGLGDGYVEALRKAWKKHKPDSWDFVMFWWHQAAELVQAGKTRRFGFITTNSIHQTFNRRCVEAFLNDPKKPLHLAFAIPDHPWVDSADGAAVRIAMTVAAPDTKPGTLQQVTSEKEIERGEHEVELNEAKGLISSNLKLGVDLTTALTLQANSSLSCPGVKLHGSGFIVSREKAEELGLGKIPGLEKHIREYRNGRDISDHPRGVMVIDLLGLDESEVGKEFPDLYQYLLQAVKPERDENKRSSYKKYWWLHGEPRKDFRPALQGLPRYISTIETSKHRFFVFLDKSILPDNKLINFGLSESHWLSLLSSQIHVSWALACGGRLGFGNDPVYVKTRCFETYPFPDLEGKDALREKLADLGERLDAHRKERQAAHPDLTLTGMYNVLEKLRTGEALTDKEKKIHDNGLVTLLKQIHDDIDDATLEAYGWEDLKGDKPLADLTSAPTPENDKTGDGRLSFCHKAGEELEQEILQRLVDLNHERAAEEAKGKIRWLRPDFQAPETTATEAEESQTELEGVSNAEKSQAKAESHPWPAELKEQVALVESLLPETGTDIDQICTHLAGRNTAKRKSQISQILETLRAMGRI